MNLILHIGTEKTGTTFLQEWLYQNRAPLSAQGVFLSGVLDYPNNRKLVSWVQTSLDDYTRMQGVSSVEEKARFFAGFEQEFADEVRRARHSHHSMIITSEHFHSRLGTVAELVRLKRLLSSLFNTVHIICYVREQADLHASLYSTALRLSFTSSITEFKPVTADGQYYNYDNLASLWAGVFGRECLDFRIYNRNEFFNSDIRQDFLQVFGSALDVNRLNYSVGSSNTRLSLLQGAAFRVVNEQLPYWNNGRIDANNQFFKNILEGCDALRHGSIQDHRQEEFNRLFFDSNKRFFERYIGAGKSFAAAQVGRDQKRDVRLALKEVADIIANMLRCILKKIGKRLLLDRDADFLSAVAMKFETQTPLTREEAVELMNLARRARPHDQLIDRKLLEWGQS